MFKNTSWDTIYDDLMHLCSVNESFYFQDHTHDDDTYRIFNYRLATYTDFLVPGAMECRGHTFRVSGDSQFLVCSAMEKFFNVNENPMTMGLDWSQVVRVEDKRDGSLISTCRTPYGWILKSKGSLSSSQAVDATRWIARNNSFRDKVDNLVVRDFTINMEWTSGSNQIVLRYNDDALKVLNIRCNTTGEYFNPLDFFDASEVVDFIHFGSINQEWVDNAYTKTGIEGFVIHFADGMKCKLKTEEYSVLHRSKDSINNPRRLFEVVLMDASDDLRAMFANDPLSIQLIEDMENKVKGIFNRLHKLVTDFHYTNKDLDRKSYAILGQEKLNPDGVFPLAMNLYLGRDIGLKEHMMKHYKDYGITDKPTDSD